MYVEYTCSSINIDKWNELMKGSRKASYKLLVKRIKEKIPLLYEVLGLQYYNPYDYKTKQTKTHYILVHSAIEYFIRK